MMIRNWALPALLLFAAGCHIDGKWNLAKVEPTAAQRDVEFHSLVLDRDGSFYAEAKEGEAIRTTSGTYTYENRILSLKAHDGERHTYDATLVGDQLCLASHWEGRKLDLKYERTH